MLDLNGPLLFHSIKQAKDKLSAGQAQQAADLLQKLCKVHTRGKSSREAIHSIQEGITLLPDDWCAQYWSACITRAQEPNPVSSRDGRVLKPVPRQWKLAPSQLTKHLAQAVHKARIMQAGLLTKAWGCAGQPNKASLAMMRGHAYVQAGVFEQALRDAKVVLAYAPRQVEDPARCAWAWAHALHSAALEGLQDNVTAALAMQIALEMAPGNNSYAEDLERLLRRVPLPVADALEAGGSAGLQEYLAEEEERRKPEYLKQRPKYYYYYEWMKERITATHPALPEPVMDKLLTMPAGDLDLILQHPQATHWKVDELMAVLGSGGAAALEGYPLQALSWKQVKQLKGPNLVGLGIGDGPAPGEGLIDSGPDRHEQLRVLGQRQALLEEGSCGQSPDSTAADSVMSRSRPQEDEDLDAVEWL